MKVEVLEGFIHIYPRNAKEEFILEQFVKTGVNEQVGALRQTTKDGVPLKEKKLKFIQITPKGTPLGEDKVK